MAKALLLTSDEGEASALQDILCNYAWLVHARNLSEMLGHLQGETYDVLLCAWAFYRSCRNGALQEVRERYPDLPVLVLSLTGEEGEWFEMLETGAFDLLSLPFPKAGAFGRCRTRLLGASGGLPHEQLLTELARTDFLHDLFNARK